MLCSTEGNQPLSRLLRLQSARKVYRGSAAKQSRYWLVDDLLLSPLELRLCAPRVKIYTVASGGFRARLGGKGCVDSLHDLGFSETLPSLMLSGQGKEGPERGVYNCSPPPLCIPKHKIERTQ